MNARLLNNHTIATVAMAKIQPPTINKSYREFLLSPTTLTLAGCTILIAVLNFTSNKKNSQLAKAYWGSDKEVSKAKKKALKQIAEPRRNSACLYINLDKSIRQKRDAAWQKLGHKDPIAKNYKDKGRDSKIPTLYLPDVQRGVSVIGAAGTGKTFSVIDPAIRSSLDQGFPTIIYDFKYPAQTKRAAAYAAARGYKVRVFAPGKPESYTCNPLDFLRDEEDAIAAGQLAQTINKNMNAGGANKGGDKFFEQAGDSLVEGIFLVTKAVPKLLATKYPEEFALPDGSPNEDALSYCDLMTSQAILSLPNIAERLFQARDKGIINDWTSIPLSQVISTKDSEKTVAGIVSTAIAVFQRFLKRDFVGAFCGETNLELDIDGKELVIFGLDRNNRDIVGPLLAAILHMTVSRNVSRTIPRKDPLVTFIDELPTLYLPALVNWLNENREDGFCGVLGYQNFAQLVDRYGKEIATAIFGGTATKFIFNPQEDESAQRFSKILGEEEISYQTKSKSTSKGVTTNSKNNNKQKRSLFAPEEFGKLGTGRCVILNPNYRRGDEAYIPLLKSIGIRSEEIAHQDWSENSWDSVQQFIVNSNKNSLMHDPNIDEVLRHRLQERASLAERLFPLESPVTA